MADLLAPSFGVFPGDSDGEQTSDVEFWDIRKDGTTGGEGYTYSANPWDFVIIGGQKLPGICRVKGQPTLAFDKKKSKGVDGATITVNGYLPGPIDIECKMWTADQWSTFLDIAPIIWSKPNKKMLASDIAKDVSHPAFTLWGIKAVVILGVSVPEEAPERGAKIVKIKCVEYVPQQKRDKSATPKAAKAKRDPRLDATPSPGKSIKPGGEK